MTKGGLAALWGLVALLAAWARLFHVDDTDAGLYRAVVRNMAEDGAWLSLRYLPTVHAAFREHLPFGFWPYALAQRLGDSAPLALGWAASLAVLALIGRRRPLAALILGATPSFFELAATVRLDQLLLVGTTAAGLALLDAGAGGGAGDASRWAVVALGSVAGVAIKGPFGLVPLAAIAAARAILERRPGLLAGAAAVAALSLLGPGLFLWQSWRTGGDWWSGYAAAQLFASATGARTDGATGYFYPWFAVLARFWPGLPLVAFAAWQAGRHRALRPLALALAFMLLALGLPARKVWNHTLVVFPFLALWCAEALEAPWPARIEAARRWLGARAVLLLATPLVALGGVAIVALLAGGPLVATVRLGGGLPYGLARRLPHCLAPAAAVAWARGKPPEALAVLRPADGSVWKVLAVLAGEYRLLPRLVDSPPAALAAGAHGLLVRDEAPVGWSCPEGEGWRLCLR